MEKTPELLVQANEALKEMEDIIYSPQHCSEQGLSYDDIALFARLRWLFACLSVCFSVCLSV